MGISVQRQSSPFASQLSFYSNRGLKSAEEKQKRQMQCEKKICFWQDRKESLKTMECTTLGEITKKLDLLHTYEEEIRAAKTAYNNEQIWHIMDEARELGEKIAKEAEKQKAKTPEEREEERRKEALDVEESEGVLTELLDEMDELTEELQEELYHDEKIDKVDIDADERKAELIEQERNSIEEHDLQAEQERELVEEQKFRMEKQSVQREKQVVLEENVLQAYKRLDMRI